MFVKRKEGIGIIYSESYPTDKKMKNTVSAGDTVVLKMVRHTNECIVLGSGSSAMQ